MAYKWDNFTRELAWGWYCRGQWLAAIHDAWPWPENRPTVLEIAAVIDARMIGIRPQGSEGAAAAGGITTPAAPVIPMKGT